MYRKHLTHHPAKTTIALVLIAVSALISALIPFYFA
jgi:hypothetical protein